LVLGELEVSGNFINEKYQGKYRGASDWIGELIDAECLVEDKDGNVSLDLKALFALAKANGIDTAKYKAQAEQPHATGRLRMTLGNALRARARRRHGLLTADGTRKKLTDPKSIEAPPEPIEKIDGTPIEGAKKAPAKKGAKKAPAKKAAKKAPAKKAAAKKSRKKAA
jgi:hypothetical protein